MIERRGQFPKRRPPEPLGAHGLDVEVAAAGGVVAERAGAEEPDARHPVAERAADTPRHLLEIGALRGYRAASSASLRVAKTRHLAIRLSRTV